MLNLTRSVNCSVPHTILGRSYFMQIKAQCIHRRFELRSEFWNIWQRHCFRFFDLQKIRISVVSRFDSTWTHWFASSREAIVTKWSSKLFDGVRTNSFSCPLRVECSYLTLCVRRVVDASNCTLVRIPESIRAIDTRPSCAYRFKKKALSWYSLRMTWNNKEKTYLFKKGKKKR